MQDIGFQFSVTPSQLDKEFPPLQFILRICFQFCIRKINIFFCVSSYQCFTNARNYTIDL
jgi:hypothetical protein